MIEKIAYLRNTYKNRRIEILIDYYILLYFLSFLFCFCSKIYFKIIYSFTTNFSPSQFYSNHNRFQANHTVT